MANVETRRRAHRVGSGTAGRRPAGAAPPTRQVRSRGAGCPGPPLVAAAPRAGDRRAAWSHSRSGPCSTTPAFLDLRPSVTSPIWVVACVLLGAGHGGSRSPPRAGAPHRRRHRPGPAGPPASDPPPTAGCCRRAPLPRPWPRSPRAWPVFLAGYGIGTLGWLAAIGLGLVAIVSAWPSDTVPGADRAPRPPRPSRPARRGRLPAGYALVVSVAWWRHLRRTSSPATPGRRLLRRQVGLGGRARQHPATGTSSSPRASPRRWPRTRRSPRSRSSPARSAGSWACTPPRRRGTCCCPCSRCRRLARSGGWSTVGPRAVRCSPSPWRRLPRTWWPVRTPRWHLPPAPALRGQGHVRLARSSR